MKPERVRIPKGSTLEDIMTLIGIRLATINDDVKFDKTGRTVREYTAIVGPLP